MPYRVVILGAARDQLRHAPPRLLGYVDGILSVLRVDPDMATAAFDMRIVDDEFREAIFADGHGMLGIWVLRERHIVAVTHVTWLSRAQRPGPRTAGGCWGCGQRASRVPPTC